MAGCFEAPARVNLLGEHTDYTGGLVLPLAISFKTCAQIEPRADDLYEFTSATVPGTRRMSVENRSGRVGDWSDYAVGVLRQLQARGVIPPPFSLRFKSTVPLGAGLSSSASLEVATAVAVLSFSGAMLPTAKIAMLCRQAENEYVGAPYGIMDQFVVAAARANHALLLQTRELHYEQLPIDRRAIRDCAVVSANSMVKHSVASGEYGLRRQELEFGQSVLLKRFTGLRDLGEATLEQLAKCQEAMTAESFLRCRHVITENGRACSAAGVAGWGRAAFRCIDDCGACQ